MVKPKKIKLCGSNIPLYDSYITISNKDKSGIFEIWFLDYKVEMTITGSTFKIMPGLTLVVAEDFKEDGYEIKKLENYHWAFYFAEKKITIEQGSYCSNLFAGGQEYENQSLYGYDYNPTFNYIYVKVPTIIEISPWKILVEPYQLFVKPMFQNIKLGNNYMLTNIRIKNNEEDTFSFYGREFSYTCGMISPNFLI